MALQTKLTFTLETQESYLLEDFNMNLFLKGKTIFCYENEKIPYREILLLAKNI